jgi:hypothetical protein
MTVVLRIEHPVGDFVRWHAAFHDDPAKRKRGGVRCYRVMRAHDDPNYVLIDLEFDEQRTAEAFLCGLRDLWRRVDVVRDPQALIVELVEEESLASEPVPS